jgi:hypothetical protein
MTDIPRMANKRKIISPDTIPAMTPRDGVKPDAMDREMVANTPGPGVAARINNATARLKTDNKLIITPHYHLVKSMILTHFCLFSSLIVS